MITNAQIKLLQSLKQKKVRSELGLFVAEGVRISDEMLGKPHEIVTVYAIKSWIDKHSDYIADLGDKLVEIKNKELERISFMTTPNEVLCVAKIPRSTINDKELSSGYTIALDRISDPGNLGAIIRIADWFGIRNIVCSDDCVDLYNPKVVQASMGSFIRVRVHYQDLRKFLDESIEHLKLPVFGFVLDGENIQNREFGTKGILIFGNEADGISNKLQKFITQKVTIPRMGGAESLNVAAAVSVACWEILGKSIHSKDKGKIEIH